MPGTAWSNIPPAMQTLGLADSTPRSESRLKSLFWPSIQSGADVDYLGVQGYLLCTAFAILAFLSSVAIGHPIAGAVAFVFYYLSGVGIRERSRYAAGMAFVFALAELLILPGILKIFFAGLLLSNLRATWIASSWKPDTEESELPPRLTATWGDRFSDRLPSWLWPKVRAVYYVLSVAFMLLFFAGMAMFIHHGPSSISRR